MPSATPIRFETVHPVLCVDDLDDAIAFYRDRLGFDVRWTWGEPAFRVGVGRDGIELQLTSDAETRPAAPAQLYFHLVGVDAYYAECVANGATITFELEERPWGMRDFRVVDPAGNRLGFGEPIAAT